MSTDISFAATIPFSRSVPAGYHPVAQHDASQVKGLAPQPCVLLVDDEEAIREVMTDLLQEHNLRVLSAGDGAAGIELYRTNAADVRLVLLDLTMPGMTGEEVFRQFKEIDPTVRVILTSGYGREEATSKFPASELAGFVQKPFHWTQLAKTIVEYVGGGQHSV